MHAVVNEQWSWSQVGGNYAPGINPQIEAASKGYSQNLWLFGDDHQVTEVGTMNFFVLWKNENGGAWHG
jgi:branched-chain amino acid aminotransferase